MNKIIKKLATLADYLDDNRRESQANMIDDIIKKMSSAGNTVEFVSKLGDRIEFAVSSDGSVSHSYQQSAASKAKGGEGRSEEESQMHNYGMGSKNFSIAELIDKGGPDYGGGAFKDFYKLTPASKVSLKEIYKKNRSAIHSRDDGTNSSKIDVGMFADRFKKDIGYFDELNAKQDPLFADPFADPEPSPKSSPLPDSEQKKDYGQGRSLEDISEEVGGAASAFFGGSDAAISSVPDRIKDESTVPMHSTLEENLKYMKESPSEVKEQSLPYGDRLKDETMVAIPPTMEDFNEHNALEDNGPVNIGWAIVSSVIKNKEGKVTQISGRYKLPGNNSSFTFDSDTANNALKNTLTDLARKGFNYTV